MHSPCVWPGFLVRSIVLFCPSLRTDRTAPRGACFFVGESIDPRSRAAPRHVFPHSLWCVYLSRPLPCRAMPCPTTPCVLRSRRGDSVCSCADIFSVKITTFAVRTHCSSTATGDLWSKHGTEPPHRAHSCGFARVALARVCQANTTNKHRKSCQAEHYCCCFGVCVHIPALNK